jgi:hypothetical protein
MSEKLTREVSWHIEFLDGDVWRRPSPPMRNLSHARQDMRNFQDLNPNITYRLVEERRTSEVIA